MEDLRSSFSVVGFGNPVIFLADGFSVGLVLKRRSCEDGEVEIEEELSIEVCGLRGVVFGEID